MLTRAVAVGLGGVLVGLWLGIIVSGLVAQVVPGLPARAPDTVLRPALALILAAVAGVLFPAWRAVRAAPAVLLGPE